MRENGTLNELCPCHEESIPKMRQWIDEIAALGMAASQIAMESEKAVNEKINIEDIKRRVTQNV